MVYKTPSYLISELETRLILVPMYLAPHSIEAFLKGHGVAEFMAPGRGRLSPLAEPNGAASPTPSCARRSVDRARKTLGLERLRWSGDHFRRLTGRCQARSRPKPPDPRPRSRLEGLAHLSRGPMSLDIKARPGPRLGPRCSLDTWHRNGCRRPRSP